MDGVEQTQQAALSEVFRRYFSSTFRNDGGEDPPLNYPANNHMQHFIILVEGVHWQLTYLNTNKSEGAGEIHPKILASLASFLATPLANVANCRPICFTFVVCKILERIVKANILQYLITASILSDAQHGFMPRSSCLTNLIVAEE